MAFRTAGSYFGHSNMSPQWQTGAALGGLIGQMIAGNRQRQRDEKDTNALTGLLTGQFTPQQTPEQQAAAEKASQIQAGQQVAQANKGLLDNAAYLQSLGMSPEEVQVSMAQATAQPTESVRNADGTTAAVTPDMQAKWDSNLNATINAKPDLTLDQTKQQYNDWSSKQMREALAQMSPEARKQYLPMMLKMRDEGMAQAESTWRDNEGNKWIDAAMNAAKPADQKKAFVNYARATGKMDAGTLRGLLAYNNVFKDDGANILTYRTDSMGNFVDVDEQGQPKPYFSVEKKMSPTEADASARGWAAIAQRGSGGGGGGTASDGRYIDVPGLGKMTPAQVLTAYRQAMGGTVQVDDGMGGVKTTTRPPNPDILRLLSPIVKQVRSDLGLPQVVEKTEYADINAKQDAMRAAGADEKTINDMTWEELEKKKQRQGQGAVRVDDADIPPMTFIPG